MNERITENFVRKHFDKFTSELIIEEQKSLNPRINKLLASASKSGKSNGRPEFIVQFIDCPDLLLIIECKADIKKHESPTRDKYSEYAVDGVLLYSSFLSHDFDVISIAVSGQNSSNLKISHFLQLKNERVAMEKFSDKLLTANDYVQGYNASPEKHKQDYNQLLKFSKSLNEKLHKYKIVESDRALLISCILIALENKSFSQTYKDYKNSEDLAKYLVDTAEMEFKNGNIGDKKLDIIRQRYSFIKTDTSLSTRKGVLFELIREIKENIQNFIKSHEYFDILGQLYIEFLRYANSDKGLGIVLTPPHITKFMAKLGEVNKNSTVYDNCTGTGGFLVSAMNLMIDDAKDDQSRIQSIKHNQIIGTEFQAHIFALACSNMFIHQDGKSNILKGSCFDQTIIDEVKKMHPTVGLLNPPYKDDVKELEFVLNNLECLDQGGKCVAILPMSVALSQSGEELTLKEKLLVNHTLEAVLSMPNELFHNSKVGVVSCIMVITAKRPHPHNKKVFFGAFKNDGFIKEKNKGRIDSNNSWDQIESNWITIYQNKEEVPDLSINHVITAKDEWCAEEFMNTDYSILTEESFKKATLNYLSHCIYKEDLSNIKLFDIRREKITLDTNKWKEFKVLVIFKVSLGKPIHKNSLSNYSDRFHLGWIPYVTRTTTNNGVELYISPEKINTSKIQDENVITIGAEGFKAFFQKNKFITGNKVNILKGEKINQFSALFLCTVLNLEISKKFNYGRGLVKSRLEKLSIKLPEKNNEPNYELMEKYIRNLPFGIGD